MGIDGMNSADIFDEYFDDEKRKYIIKNCPAFDSKYNECHSKIEPHKIYCADCTDCVLKQIIEKCKLFQNNYLVNDGVQLLTTNILNSLDIQECE